MHLKLGNFPSSFNSNILITVVTTDTMPNINILTKLETDTNPMSLYVKLKTNVDITNSIIGVTYFNNPNVLHDIGMS